MEIFIFNPNNWFDAKDLEEGLKQLEAQAKSLSKDPSSVQERCSSFNIFLWMTNIREFLTLKDLEHLLNLAGLDLTDFEMFISSEREKEQQIYKLAELQEGKESPFYYNWFDNIKQNKNLGLFK